MRFELCMLVVLILLSVRLMADGEQTTKGGFVIDAMPAGYSLYAYDDCGVPGRQPHVDMVDAYNFTFALSDTDADLRSRSAVFSYKELRINYTHLDPKRSYVLAMTYASDHVYKRVQSLWADGVELHGPMPLPNAKAIRVIVKVPDEVTKDGKLALAIKIHGEVNATASIIELWATGPATHALRFGSVTGVVNGLAGQVIDLAYNGVKDAAVSIYPDGKKQPIATSTTDSEGKFHFEEEVWKDILDGEALHVTASSGGTEVSTTVPASDLGFKPVQYTPIPAVTQGLKTNQVSLDGTWRINTNPGDSFQQMPLTGNDWADLHVPGQWKQQGFDVPQDKTVAMAREFAIPKEWSDYRILLRFDAIHAGTDYWVNGKHIGASENLYTPVEFDITGAVTPGKSNRIDLRMKVDTVSEKLSYSSGYAFHSLGGIDRSVHIFALPKTSIKAMHVSTDLDKQYKDAQLKVQLTIDAPESANHTPLQLAIRLLGPDGKPGLRHDFQKELKSLHTGENKVGVEVIVPYPLKWTAEKPNLYRLVLELKQGETVLERTERNLGFRKIEIRGRQVYINGQRVKFAGACHHEFDPLTGRADTMRHAEQDVKIAKDINLNYLRTSHYPPTQEFLDACDRLGMYVEVEAPFCWVQPTQDLTDLKQVLTPTSAMVDYCHTHPSVIIWSVANESNFNEFFEYSDKLIKQLDPTRPTTFNNPDPKQICDIANVHYPPAPYDDVLKDDPRPLFLGEYWFPVCHEQTDVNINPGLRELWGHAQAEPDSDFAKEFAKGLYSPCILPGARPGTWSDMYHSDRVIGGAIWALIDEPFYFSDGTHCGYAWHHGFWGLFDAWRRPKPEAWLAKMIFSPVWLPQREVPFERGQETITVPVENRYSFTDLSELTFSYQIGRKKGKASASGQPGRGSSLVIPVPGGTPVGSQVLLKVTDKQGNLINAVQIRLGKQQPIRLPQPDAGAPKWSDDGRTIYVETAGGSFSIDRATGAVTSQGALASLPALHLTRHDYGDLNGPKSPPYAVFPDAKTRVIEGISAAAEEDALEITVNDHYDGFAGSVTWLIDKTGLGTVSYDYAYSGEEMDTRERGISMLLKPQCDELKWKRWSEWGDVFPEDSISRTEGSVTAHRPKNLPNVPDTTQPSWPWSQDQTELGTADFRSIKFNIYQASLVAPDGSGVEALSNAKAHVRACLTERGVKLHILDQCTLGSIKLKSGDRLTGKFTIRVLGGNN